MHVSCQGDPSAVGALVCTRTHGGGGVARTMKRALPQDACWASVTHAPPTARGPDARLLLAGGKPDQVERARAQAAAAGIGSVTIFAGERPAPEIPAYLLACDALVSPRSRGTNTPLKIYQYLRSGKAIVATRLLTHTQVLDDETAILTGASAREFADGILVALTDRARAASVGASAQHLAETKYSYEAYLDRTRQACEAQKAKRPHLTVRPLCPMPRAGSSTTVEMTGIEPATSRVRI